MGGHGQAAIIDIVLPLECRNAARNGVIGRLFNHNGGERIFVPDIQQVEYDHRCQNRLCNRHKNLRHQLPQAHAVHQRRLVKLLGYGTEIGSKQQRIEGNGCCDIRQDQRQLLAKTKEFIDLIDRKQQDKRADCSPSCKIPAGRCAHRHCGNTAGSGPRRWKT